MKKTPGLSCFPKFVDPACPIRSFIILVIYIFVLLLDIVWAFPNDEKIRHLYPEPDPPVSIRGKIKKAPLPEKYAPSGSLTEWIYHKTTDNLHPDATEQQMVWLINRARTNPTNEGTWLATSQDPRVADGRSYFNVDTSVLQNEFTAYSPKPPAAFDLRLYDAARAHSENVTNHRVNFFSHYYIFYWRQ